MLIIYIGAFVKFLNQKNYNQVYEIYKIVELKKMCTLIMKNSYYFGVY